MNKKRNNKGFSLVELIVVIAVMAVLVVVLAPAYLRYVDKAKVQKDVSAVSEVVQAIKIAAAEEAVAEEIVTGTKVTISGGQFSVSGQAANTDGADLLKEIKATVGDSLTFSSKAFTAADAADVVITITMDAADYNVSVSVTGPTGADFSKIK